MQSKITHFKICNNKQFEVQAIEISQMLINQCLRLSTVLNVEVLQWRNKNNNANSDKSFFERLKYRGGVRQKGPT